MKLFITNLNFLTLFQENLTKKKFVMFITVRILNSTAKIFPASWFKYPLAYIHGRFFIMHFQFPCLGQCQRPSCECCMNYWDIYESVDCDGDGILDHACSTTINNNRWLVLSSEGCPNSWGSDSQPASKCPQAFGGIVVFWKNIFISINLLQIYQLLTSDFSTI